MAIYKRKSPLALDPQVIYFDFRPTSSILREITDWIKLKIEFICFTEKSSTNLNPVFNF